MKLVDPHAITRCLDCDVEANCDCACCLTHGPRRCTICCSVDLAACEESVCEDAA